MTDAPPPLDRPALFASLSRNHVWFVLVGGLAAQAHGAARATQDADICPEWSCENLARLAASLTELDARLKIGEGSIETLEIQIDARTIHGLEIGAWRTAAGDVDVLLGKICSAAGFQRITRPRRSTSRIPTGADWITACRRPSL